MAHRSVSTLSRLSKQKLQTQPCKANLRMIQLIESLLYFYKWHSLSSWIIRKDLFHMAKTKAVEHLDTAELVPPC